MTIVIRFILPEFVGRNAEHLTLIIRIPFVQVETTVPLRMAASES
ncbi:MAG: hypothetical protein ACC742_12120 [Thermoanaerobaculales bacterium]